MILVFKTSTPICEMVLYENNEKIAKKSWEAGRQLAVKLPGRLEDFLKENNFSWRDIKGIVVFKGPGSFTGLRIGITAVNTIAYAQNIPIVGAQGENWVRDGLSLLESGKNEKVVLPYYGGSAHITKPKK